MTDHTHEELVALPASGRVFESRRRVRLGDCSPGGRLRLDAGARYLQDIANDDSRDAGSENPTAWVARRTVIRVEQFPEYLDVITSRTWCSGLGQRWAERRYSVTTSDGADGSADQTSARIEAATLWVHVDMRTMKPINVPVEFASQFGEAAAGRQVSARLHLPARPVRPVTIESYWPARFVDFDVLGHMNNAVYWAIVEEQLARLRDIRAPLTVTLEHRDAIDAGASIRVALAERERGFDMWITTTDERVAAVVRATPS